MNNTIFDDVFRTMIEKMPYLAVPLINEVFHTSYPENVPIVQLRNEHQQENGEIITDSCLKIAGKLYHIECQSVDDTTMAIRMIEYDFSIAIENAQKQGRKYRMDFPKSCVLYLRSGKNTPDFLEINLERELSGADKTALYMNLNKLIIKIADYICQNEKTVRKGIGEIMGGKVLELESERLERLQKEAEAEAKAIGEARGRAIGEAKGIAIGEAKGIAIGEAKGIAIGEAIGEERLSTLLNRLIMDGRSAEIQSVVTNAETRKRLYKEYGILSE